MATPIDNPITSLVKPRGGVLGSEIKYATLGDSRLANHCSNPVNLNSVVWNGVGNASSGQMILGYKTTPSLRNGLTIRYNPPSGDASAALAGVYTINRVIQTASSATVTFAGGATPTINWTSNGLNLNDQVCFTNSGGALPVEITANQTYFVVTTGTNTFSISATAGGAAINFSGAGTGTHTGFRYGLYAVSCNPSITGGGPALSGTFIVTVLDWLLDSAWSHWAGIYSNQRMRLVFNGGKGADTAALCAARVGEITSRTDVQYCFVDVGFNDYNNANGTVAATVTSTTNTVMGYIQTICNALIDANITPVLLTLVPSSGPTSFTNAASIANYVNQHNNLLKALAYSYANKVILIDQFEAVCDPTTGYILGGDVQPNTFTVDGVHPGRQWGRSVGKLISDRFIPSASSSMPAFLVSSALDNARISSANYNVIQSAPFTNTGGTLTGTGATNTASAAGWAGVWTTTGAGTCVATCPARTFASDGDTAGYNQQYVITSGAANDSLDVRLNLTPDNNYYTLMSAGTYELRGIIKLINVSGSNLKNITCWSNLQFTDPNTSIAHTALDILLNPTAAETKNIDTTSLGYLTSQDGTLILRSQPWTFTTAPTGQNGVGIRSILTFSAAGTAITVQFGRWSFVRIA